MSRVLFHIYTYRTVSGPISVTVERVWNVTVRDVLRAARLAAYAVLAVLFAAVLIGAGAR